MLKKINQLLKLVGFNLVHAKGAKGTVTGRKSKTVYIAGPCGPTGLAGKDCRTYPARSAFTTADDGRTHYVGDDCPGGHGEVEDLNCAVGAVALTMAPGGHVDDSPKQDNNITGPTS